MQQKGRLRAGSLTFIEVLAASLALVGLSMTPVLIAPYMYAAAGNGSWLAYVFAGVMLLLVAMSLNRFARRGTGAGSMFLYAARELGPALGALAGWSLIWAYVFVGAANFGAQALFWGQLGTAAGLTVPALLTMVALAAVCMVLAVRDVALSTIVMLALESISVAIICTLAGFVLLKHGPHLDLAQLQLSGTGKASIGLGIATAIFSFVGFESATAFGAEARNPFSTIPRAVVWSVIIASCFFVLTIYVEILGLRGAKTPLDQQTAPLWALAVVAGTPYLKIPITIGAIFSSFSVALACVNTCARIMLPMAQGGLLPKALSAIQPRFSTPHVALAVASVTMLAIGASMYISHVAPIDIFNYCGTLSSLSFIVIYFLIAMAAPRYLRRIGELRAFDTVLAVTACLFLAGTAVTLFYPLPPPPTTIFPYLFLVYLAAGLAIFFTTRGRVVTPALETATEEPLGEAP
jgi:amino acid transporter